MLPTVDRRCWVDATADIPIKETRMTWQSVVDRVRERTVMPLDYVHEWVALLNGLVNPKEAEDIIINLASRGVTPDMLRNVFAAFR